MGQEQERGSRIIRGRKGSVESCCKIPLIISQPLRNRRRRRTGFVSFSSRRPGLPHTFGIFHAATRICGSLQQDWTDPFLPPFSRHRRRREVFSRAHRRHVSAPHQRGAVRRPVAEKIGRGDRAVRSRGRPRRARPQRDDPLRLKPPPGVRPQGAGAPPPRVSASACAGSGKGWFLPRKTRGEGAPAPWPLTRNRGTQR